MLRMAVMALLLFALFGCGRSERMETLYAQRCLGCHGPLGKGDGPLAESLPVRPPDFRNTVERRTTGEIRQVIARGKGLMPAFEPAFRARETQDMVLMVRLLSREGRDVKWWEKFDSLVWAHCSVPWESVFGYDEPEETQSQ